MRPEELDVVRNVLYLFTNLTRTEVEGIAHEIAKRCERIAPSLDEALAQLRDLVRSTAAAVVTESDVAEENTRAAWADIIMNSGKDVKKVKVPKAKTARHRNRASCPAHAQFVKGKCPLCDG